MILTLGPVAIEIISENEEIIEMGTLIFTMFGLIVQVKVSIISTVSGDQFLPFGFWTWKRVESMF